MSDPFLGEIRMFGGNFAPVGWAPCDGQLLAISDNEALFALIGTTYGGDGITTFALPDLRGRVPTHQGSGPGLTSRTIGAKFGTEAETIAANQVGAHGHTLRGSDAAATTRNPSGMALATALGGVYFPNTDPTPMLPTPAASSQAHNNVMPFLSVNFIIALAGIFPSQT